MWMIDSTRIYVQDFNRTNNQIVAKLQPISSKTVYHIFGDESEIINLEGIVVGNNDRNYLKSIVHDGNLHSLTGYYSISYNDIIIHSVKDKLLKTICQTIRPDLGADAPVYSVSIELYRNEL